MTNRDNLKLYQFEIVCARRELANLEIFEAYDRLGKLLEKMAES